MTRRLVWGATLALSLLAPWALADVNVSGTAYLDYAGTNSEVARDSALLGLTPDFALKVDIDPLEHVAFSAKACIGCHGVVMERVHVEYTPRPWLNVQAGRIVVPFGDYPNRYDAAGHRPASSPMMFEMGRMLFYRTGQLNLGVLPAPYVDNGALVYGQVWLGSRVQVWYGGYVVGGLKGENDIDWQAMYSSYFNDNNRAPAGGGRVVVTYSSDEADALLKDVSVGFSGMYGLYDRALTRGYLLLGVDASARIGPVSIRGEVALRRTDLNPALPGYGYVLVDPWIEKTGFYAEVEHPLFGDRLYLAYRFDGLRRVGVPLPGSDPRMTPDVGLLRYTQALQVSIVTGLFAKASYEYWLPGAFPDAHVVHVGLGGTF